VHLVGQRTDSEAFQAGTRSLLKGGCDDCRTGLLALAKRGMSVGVHGEDRHG
jgi:hypothetical protein